MMLKMVLIIYLVVVVLGLIPIVNINVSNTSRFPIFWTISALPPKRRALDVHEVVARVANPSSSTATGPLGAQLDPR